MRVRFVPLLLVVLISACEMQKSAELSSMTTNGPTEIITVTSTVTANIVPTKTIDPNSKETEIPAAIKINSPLAGVELDQLTALVFNPFHLPPDGSDDPHQGVDFSFIDPQTQIAVNGSEVQAFLSGRIDAIMDDRFPYGNAVLISAPIISLPLPWKEILNKMAAPSLWLKTSALSCPEGWNEVTEDNSSSILYILYAHLQNQVQLKVGDQITTGTPIGQVGMSGNALAPHLHIEIRYGSLADFSAGMAHYTVSASVEEMKNYCRWRISGWFRPIDPMLLLLSQNP